MPPDKRQRRPPYEAAAANKLVSTTSITNTITLAQGTTAAADMRRRREAADRLPPLDSGHRDPLDELAGLPITEADCCRGMFGANGRWQPCCRGAA